jgi:hypothetical protein
MSDHKEGAPILFSNLAKQFENLLSGIRIKRAGRLVGKHDRGTPGYSSCDSYALSFSNRKLIRSGMKTIAQSDPMKDFSGPLKDIRTLATAEPQPNGNILDCGERSKEMEGLEHHSTMGTPMLVELCGVQGSKVNTGHRHLANIGATQTRDKVEKGALSATTRSGKSNRFPGFDLKGREFESD